MKKEEDEKLNKNEQTLNHANIQTFCMYWNY